MGTIDLNHPLAVVAILSVTFAGLGIVFREVMSAVKARKISPNADYNDAIDIVRQTREALQKIVLHVEMENQALKETLNSLQKISTQMDRNSDAIEDTRRMVHKIVYRSRSND